MNKQNSMALFFFVFLLFISCGKKTNFQEEFWKVRQLTFRQGVNNNLDNNLNFSPDGNWICYDTRAKDGQIADTRTIERVNIATGKIDTIYQAPNPVHNLGPGVGAVSYFPNEDKVIFIHGPDSRLGLQYQKSRRAGAIVTPGKPTQVVWADARDVTYPFTPGALRGGTHRHEPGGVDGKWIGFTYNDLIMKRLGQDLRTIGVTHLGIPVTVDKDKQGENSNGAGFSVLVVRVTPHPEEGTDQIDQAAGDSWVGRSGYLKPDGSRQLARGFIGELANRHKEVFIVDIPNDITKAGKLGPLEGTSTGFPQPPAGTEQRRLTFTKSGCEGNVRSSSDGKWLSFRSADKNGTSQIFLVSPNGGDPVQVTFLPNGVSTEARWHSGGRFITFAANRQIYIADIKSNPARPVTPPFPDEPTNLVWSPDGKWIAFNQTLKGDQQIILVKTGPKFWAK